MPSVLTPAVLHSAFSPFLPMQWQDSHISDSLSNCNSLTRLACSLSLRPVYRSKELQPGLSPARLSFSLPAEWRIGRTGFSPGYISSASWRTRLHRLRRFCHILICEISYKSDFSFQIFVFMNNIYSFFSLKILLFHVIAYKDLSFMLILMQTV